MHTYFEESTQWTKKGMKGCFFFKKKNAQNTEMWIRKQNAITSFALFNSAKSLL